MLKNTLLQTSLLLISLSYISCNDDDNYCPNGDLFFDEFRAIEECSKAKDSNDLELAIVGSWTWNYEYRGWTGIDCERLSGTNIEFKSNGQFVVNGDESSASTWEIIAFASGEFAIRVNSNSTFFSNRAYVCENKLSLSSPGIADSDIHIFSKSK